ncbi:LTA synthase family protein [Lentibacillus sp. Marseille-P4043]|uniref:LTA synthase family protein n=1 Tax=Lentibacillus sp. Marseille-P4043 TaxID=2040293 RepID=UPI00131A564C|nr:LTA synthase family protein [Lentibacillus sp. Marseille-P4043]
MVVYEKYFGTIPTYYDLGQLNQVGSVGESTLMLISPMDFLFFLDFVIIGILFSMRRFLRFPVNINLSKWFVSVVLFICLLISISNFMVHRDERILDQALFSENNGLLNSQFIKGYRDSVASSHTQIANSVDEIIKLKGNDPVPFAQHDNYGVAEGKNLIILQIESLQDFVIGLKLNGQEISPNLNKWVEDSYYFTNVFQQIGSGNTSDAEFIMNTSIYPKGETPTSKYVADKKLTSLPNVLKDQGYYTATFHADTVKYWDRNILYPALGFDQYYDTEYYGENDVVGHGSSDGYFYDKTMDKLVEFNNENKPFYAHVISLTSHTPFEMPADKRMLKLPKKYKGTFIGNYLQSVHYADYALGQFFEGLKQEGLWEDSIIALYGDHSGVHGKLLQDKDVTLLHELLGNPYSLLNRFNIPFVIDIPGETEDTGKEIDSIGGQLDMMPTILNLMGITPQGLYFGQDLFQYQHNLLGMRYYLPTGAFFNDDLLYIPETSRHDIRMYDLKGKNRFDTITNPVNYFDEDYEKMLKLYEWSDAYFESLKKK